MALMKFKLHKLEAYNVEPLVVLMPMMMCADLDARLEGHQRGPDERVPHVLQPLRQEPHAPPGTQGVQGLPYLPWIQDPRRQTGALSFR